jgi:hypothetical protein
MNRIEIPEADIDVQVPDSFAEMTSRQVCFVMRLMERLQRGAISMTEFRVRVLYRLAGIKRTTGSIVWECLHPEAALERASKVVLLADELLGFLFDENGDGSLAPKFDTLTNHLPTLRIGCHRLVGPADALLDLSFAELRASNAELLLYTKTKDEAHIDNLIACLYRPRGAEQPSGRRVEPFDTGCIERNARFVRRIPAWQKQLILLWYAACMDNLHTGEFTIDGRTICFAPLFASDESSSGGESLGWLGILFDLAEKRIFGDMQDTDRANIIDILTLLYNIKLQNDNVRKADKTH